MRKLFETEEERKEFFDRHGKDVARRKDISTANGPVFLGLDIGPKSIAKFDEALTGAKTVVMERTYGCI